MMEKGGEVNFRQKTKLVVRSVPASIIVCSRQDAEVSLTSSKRMVLSPSPLASTSMAAMVDPDAEGRGESVRPAGSARNEGLGLRGG